MISRLVFSSYFMHLILGTTSDAMDKNTTKFSKVILAYSFLYKEMLPVKENLLFMGVWHFTYQLKNFWGTLIFCYTVNCNFLKISSLLCINFSWKVIVFIMHLYNSSFHPVLFLKTNQNLITEDSKHSLFQMIVNIVKYTF